MAHQPRDDGGTWSCGVGASTWVPCARRVHGRLSRVLTRRGVEVEEKCGKIGEKLGRLWRIHDMLEPSKCYLYMMGATMTKTKEEKSSL